MKTYIMGRTGLIGSALAQRCELTDDPFEADCLIFAAGYGQPAKFMADPLGTIMVNTSGLLDMIQKMKPGARLLYLSSSEVYSGLEKTPFTEDDMGTVRLDHPRACYIEAKRCGEVICNAARSVGRDVVIARVSLVYGPGFKRGDSRVLNEFVQMAFDKGFIEARDSGRAWRTYLYIDDCVGMLLNILTRGTAPVYNVAGTAGLYIHNLAYLISQVAGVSCLVPLNRQQWSAGAPPRVSINIDRYVNEFGRPEFTALEEGLRRTIDWYRAQHRLGTAA